MENYHLKYLLHAVIRYDTGVRKEALYRDLCTKVESVIGDFEPDRAVQKSDDTEKSNEPTTHQFSQEGRKEQATPEVDMKTRGRLLEKTCKIEYFIRTLKYLKLNFAELKQVQYFVISGNMDKMESLRIKLEQNETSNPPTVPVKPEMVRSRVAKMAYPV